MVEERRNFPENFPKSELILNYSFLSKAEALGTGRGHRRYFPCSAESVVCRISVAEGSV